MVAFERFDGAVTWKGLLPEQRDEIGAIALEMVASWWAQKQAADPSDGSDPVLRAALASEVLLFEELRQTFVAAVLPSCLSDGEDRPLLPSRLGPVCRSCGCSEQDACLMGCSWAEPDLCTACEEGGHHA